jgi:hypothetical protein
MNSIWIHAALLPAYLITTALRHELAHAVSAWRSGWRVTEFKCWPHRRPTGEWYILGWVSWQVVEPTPAAEHAAARRRFFLAPSLAAAASVVVGLIALAIGLPDGWLAPWLIFTVASPVVDVGWAAIRRRAWGRGDLSEL